jgi:hypothetical protein
MEIFEMMSEEIQYPANLIPNTGREIQKFEERWQRAIKDVKLVLLSPFESNVLDEETDQIKYIVKYDPECPENHFCSCHDQLFRNRPDYMKTHGVAYVCKHIMKHIIQARLF